MFYYFLRFIACLPTLFAGIIFLVIMTFGNTDVILFMGVPQVFVFLTLLANQESIIDNLLNYFPNEKVKSGRTM